MSYSGVNTVKQTPQPTHLETTSGTPIVSFHSVLDFPGLFGAPEWFSGIVARYGVRNVLELGAGAAPIFTSEQIVSLNIRYVANDVSSEELQKAANISEYWVSDLTRDQVPPEMQNRFDLVLSRMVNEHVSDGRAYHTNIHRLLKPGGISAHCFPTLYALPFLVNRLLPESLTASILNISAPERKAKNIGELRAYYSWSRGPSRGMISRFESLGFEVIEYRGYFRHGYYCRLPPLHILECFKERLLIKYPISPLCSYALMVLRKR